MFKNIKNIEIEYPTVKNIIYANYSIKSFN